jgi:general secretion pathway protein I
MKSSRGFTLIEILAAVAVLAIALAAILSGMARYADNAGYIRQKTIALWVAHNRLTEIRLAAGWPSTDKTDGQVEMAGITWKWTSEVQTTPDDYLRRIDITVQREDSDATLATLSGFIGKPQ